MATLTEKQKEVYDLRVQGLSWRLISDTLGIAESSARERYKYALERLAAPEIDSAVQTAMDEVGTELEPALVWVKTQNDNGTSYSVLLKPRRGASVDFVEIVSKAFEGMVRAPTVPAPRYINADLMTVYPLADAHIGMLAWGKETGEDYDTHIAAARVKDWIGKAVAASPPSQTAVILDVGDLTHADDQTNQTPTSKHVLDVDTRHFRTIDITIQTLVASVYLTLERHQDVIVVILPGNHDMTAYMVILFALAEHFRNNPRVTVLKQPGEWFIMEFGDVLLAAHHGHGGKPERMVMFLAENHPEAWGRTKHRFLWTGHLHHLKSADIGGVQWEQLRPLTARDAYAVSKAFAARSQLQGITLHRTRGEIQRVKVAA